MLLIIIYLYLQTFRQILATSQTKIDIKIGFLVGSKRLNHDQTYSRPGRHLIHAFNYSIHKANNQFSLERSTSKTIRFVPVIAETYGNESESIRQTIAMITKDKVDFIVGPQETCQVESKLASVFNIGMISHFCTLWKSQTDSQQVELNQSPATFIQTKPPYWKIVQRVATLLDRLLQLPNWYPQQLVLLYFREPVSQDNSRSLSLNYSHSHQRRQDGSYLLGNDALQYKLIGELLEIKLNELLLSTKDPHAASLKDQPTKRRSKSIGRKPVVVLNWHTTFHYGYTKNPFRQLLRRYLFQQQAIASTFNNQSIQCAAATSKFATTAQYRTLPNDHSQGAKLSSRAAIYIVVGHYYEHLGLMLALDELDLLGQKRRQRSQQQSSVLANQQQSLVIGVDIEQYDERDDSSRFLRGVLMDENGNPGQHHSSSEEDLNSIASMYQSYLGVVPTVPTKSAEFLNNIRELYEQNVASDMAQHQDRQEDLSMLTNRTTTLDTIQLTRRLLQFIRLPVEAFYVHDALMLLANFFADCLIKKNFTLNDCREGRRAFRWFANRKYSSSVNQNITWFDSQAQSEGSYALITRKTFNNETSDSEDDFGLVPVGHFLNKFELSETHNLTFEVDLKDIDRVWLPLWCDVLKSNLSQCLNISNIDDYQGWAQESTGTVGAVSVLISVLLIMAACLATIQLIQRKSFSSVDKQTVNNDWFDANDEKNFLNIVHNYLQTLDNNVDSCGEEESHLGKAYLNENCENKSQSAVDLHCFMFPFPSCIFVHWILALYQLKEMMFQYQSKVDKTHEMISEEISLKRFMKQLCKNDIDGSSLKGRSFFTSKHKSTRSLRLLLNKYKTINDCFCQLARLKHETVVELQSVMLNCHGNESKTVRLILEQPERGNLRDCFKSLSTILNPNDAHQFKRLILAPLISDLLDGLEYLHKSDIKFHGELRATTCMLSADWVLKLSGFHTQHMRRSLGEYEQKNLSSKELEGFIYSAPEVLENYTRRSTLSPEALKLADIYSFAFVLYEMIIDQEPWTCLTQVSKSKLLIERVKVDPSFRPPLGKLKDKQDIAPCGSTDKIFDSLSLEHLIRSCWSHSPEHRPHSVEFLRLKLEQVTTTNLMNSSAVPTKPTTTSNAARITSDAVIKPAIPLNFASILPTSSLSSSFAGSNGTTSLERRTDYQVRYIMRYYTKLLEKSSIFHRKELAVEKQRSAILRVKLLPNSIVTRLHQGERIPVRKYERVSFCSFKFNLSQATTNNPHAPVLESVQNSELLFDFLKGVLPQLDKLVESYHDYIHLLDSQVDSSTRYLVYSGEPLFMDGCKKKRSFYNETQLIASFALQLIDLVNRYGQSNSNKLVHVSCGLHTGAVVGGLLLSDDSSTSIHSSHSLLRYVLIGRTIDIANILEQTCNSQRIQMSADFYSYLNSSPLKLPPELEDNKSRQGYVAIKREAKTHMVQSFCDIETYWLLNGPRVNASQSLMMLSPS